MGKIVLSLRGSHEKSLETYLMTCLGKEKGAFIDWPLFNDQRTYPLPPHAHMHVCICTRIHMWAPMNVTHPYKREAAVLADRGMHWADPRRGAVKMLLHEA